LNPTEEELAALHEAFVPHLVRVRLDDSKCVRRPARISVLPAAAERLIRALIEAQLLTARIEDSEAIIEVTHEALFEAWPTLATWLQEEQAFLADLPLLELAMATWNKAPKRDKRAALLRGLLLNQARHYFSKFHARFSSPGLRPLGTFIVESLREERRRRWRAAAPVAMSAFLIVVGLLAWLNEDLLREHWRQVTAIEPYRLAQVRPYVLTAEAERALKPLDFFRECARECPEMVVIPAGEFLMGAPSNEIGSNNDEYPQYKVAFAIPFAASRFDVTFDDWDVCTAYGDCPVVSDGGFGRGLQPVINVSWDDAQRYVAWLSRMTGKPYRLLTESEWEYAARAGTTTSYSFGDDPANLGEYAWYLANSGARPHPLGEKKPNNFGLYDMHGNVWQWVEDCYHGSYDGAPSDGSPWIAGDCSRRVNRGGSWDNRPTLLRSAFRLRNAAGNRSYDLGFRIGRTLLPP